MSPFCPIPFIFYSLHVSSWLKAAFPIIAAKHPHYLPHNSSGFISIILLHSPTKTLSALSLSEKCALRLFWSSFICLEHSSPKLYIYTVKSFKSCEECQLPHETLTRTTLSNTSFHFPCPIALCIYIPLSFNFLHVTFKYLKYLSNVFSLTIDVFMTLQDYEIFEIGRSLYFTNMVEMTGTTPLKILVTGLRNIKMTLKKWFHIVCRFPHSHLSGNNASKWEIYII